jgi:hypothetical protein
VPTKRPAQKDCRFRKVRCLPTAFSLPFTISGNVGSFRPEAQLACRDLYNPPAHPKDHILPHIPLPPLIRVGSPLVKLRNSA